MNSVRSKLEEITNFLNIYRPLIDSHMVSFFTKNLWEKNVPSLLKEEMKKVSLNEVLFEFWNVSDNSLSCLEQNFITSNLNKFVAEARSCYLDSFDKCLNLNELQQLMKQWGCEDCNVVLDQSFMSLKKSHEVEVMSSVIASFCKIHNCSHVVDVGGGKGYLSSVLFLQHKLKVLGLDSSSSNTHVATKRTEKMKKAWNGIRKRIEAGESVIRKGKHWKAKISSANGHVESNIENIDNCVDSPLYKNNEQIISNSLEMDGNLKNNSNDLSKNFKQATQFVSHETNLQEILETSFPDDCEPNFALTGLHTCGNLASSCLRLFTDDDTRRLKFLVNVGCCYHLMTEKYPGIPSVKEFKIARCPDRNILNELHGFPMSTYLLNKQYSLSYNSRVLSSQSVERISKESKLPSITLFYRALYEVLLLNHEKNITEDLFPVGRLKCSNFTEYVFKANEKLGLDLGVTETEINQLYKDYEKYKDRLYMYFMMRVTLAPIIEAIILLDRLLYLYENGIKDAYLVRLFNPVTSPRCYGLIALRRNNK